MRGLATLPKGVTEAFRGEEEEKKKTLWESTASVYVEEVHCGRSPWIEHVCLSEVKFSLSSLTLGYFWEYSYFIAFVLGQLWLRLFYLVSDVLSLLNLEGYLSVIAVEKVAFYT